MPGECLARPGLFRARRSTILDRESNRHSPFPERRAVAQGAKWTVSFREACAVAVGAKAHGVVRVDGAGLIRGRYAEVRRSVIFPRASAHSWVR